MQEYKPSVGENINEAALNMTALAKTVCRDVIATFNDIILTASPSGDPQEIINYYHTESGHRHEEYINSPEHKEQQRQSEEAQQRRDATLKGAPTVAPQLKVTDGAKWDSWVTANIDPYGAATMRFAERWGRLMQAQIRHGKQLDDCADECCSVADSEGITGFMYGCAVGVLAETWEYGEQLRRWHNLKTQIGTEGEAANKSGGVLNSALLHVGEKETK